MKKLTLGLMFSAALLTYSSTAEATTQVQKYITNFNKHQELPVKRKHYKQTVALLNKKKVVIQAASAPIGPDDDNIRSNKTSNVLAVASRWVGTTETKNRGQLTKFMGIDPRRIPWCAGFVNAVLEKAGRSAPDTLAAADYLKFGVRTHKPSPGDIVVIRNGSRKHVGFYVQTVSVDGQRYVKVLGGNQDDSVKYHLYPANRVIQYRAINTATASL